MVALKCMDAPEGYGWSQKDMDVFRVAPVVLLRLWQHPLAGERQP